MSNAIPADFSTLAQALFLRLGIKAFDKPERFYKLDFAESAPIYLACRTEGWGELIAPVAKAEEHLSAETLLKLMSFTLAQPAAQLISLSVDSESRMLSLRSAFALNLATADAVMEQIQAIRSVLELINETLSAGARTPKRSSAPALSGLGNRFGALR